MKGQPDLDWPAIASFVRQHTHDVRNHIYGVELEATLLATTVADEECTETIKRIREQLHQLADKLARLSTQVADPSPAPGIIDAAELFLIFQEQAASVLRNGHEIDWSHTLEKEQLQVDAVMLAKVACELLSNAVAFGEGGRIRVTGRAGGDSVVYEFREPKSSPVETKRWGTTPFFTERRGAYGLGLWEAHRLVRANGGEIRHHYHPEKKELLSELSFPIHPAKRK